MDIEVYIKHEWWKVASLKTSYPCVFKVDNSKNEPQHLGSIGYIKMTGIYTVTDTFLFFTDI